MYATGMHFQLAHKLYMHRRETEVKKKKKKLRN